MPSSQSSIPFMILSPQYSKAMQSRHPVPLALHHCMPRYPFAKQLVFCPAVQLSGISMLHDAEHPSPFTALPSSQSSIPFMILSPQYCVATQSSHPVPLALHLRTPLYPCAMQLVFCPAVQLSGISMLHDAEHPSPFTALPSSQ